MLKPTKKKYVRGDDETTSTTSGDTCPLLSVWAMTLKKAHNARLWIPVQQLASLVPATRRRGYDYLQYMSVQRTAVQHTYPQKKCLHTFGQITGINTHFYSRSYYVTADTAVISDLYDLDHVAEGKPPNLHDLLLQAHTPCFLGWSCT